MVMVQAGHEPRVEVYSPRRRRSFFGVIGALLTWAGILLVALLVVGLVLLAAAPKAFGLHFVIVAGGSMQPTIAFGSVAVMRNVDDTSKLEVGDIIGFIAPATNHMTTHRIVRIVGNGDAFETRGDANNVNDKDLVPAADVRSSYVLAVPELGNVLTRIHSREGYFAAVLIPGSLVVVLELVSILRTLRRRDEPLPS